MRLIDADALERNGWSLHRTYKQDEKTMVYEVKKPSDFPTIEERGKGKWIFATSKSCYVCKDCGAKLDSIHTNFCGECGADMRNSTKPKSCFECEYSVDYDDDTVMCSEVKGIISISQNHDMIPTFCPKYVEQI